MSIAVTDSGGTLRIAQGSEIFHPYKNTISVNTRGNFVEIRWENTHAVGDNYANYTAPTGANAIAVADAIAAMLDSNTSQSNQRTLTYTVGIPGATGVDHNFTSVANVNEQSIQLGSANIIPANSPIVSIIVKCTEAISDGSATTAICDVGNTSGGDEYISTVQLETLNQMQSVSQQTVPSASASSVYFSITPGVAWNTLTAGTWKVWISYYSNDAN